MQDQPVTQDGRAGSAAGARTVRTDEGSQLPADHHVHSEWSFDVEGLLEAVQQGRERFPDLRILSGLELGEPHWHAEAVAAVMAAGHFDRVLGSLHCLPADGGSAEPPGLYAHQLPSDVVTG